LAAELGISPEYFSYLFSKNIGETFSAFLLILKIPLLVVFVPGIATLLSSFLIEPLLERHMPKEN
jgi:hypothetical protein